MRQKPDISHLIENYHFMAVQSILYYMKTSWSVCSCNKSLISTVLEHKEPRLTFGMYVYNLFGLSCLNFSNFPQLASI